MSDIHNDKKRFPDYFPASCPPSDTKENTQILFRFCHGTKPRRNDFRSYYENNQERFDGICKAYGLSVFLKKEDAISAYRKSSRLRKTFKSVAKGITDPEKGVYKSTPGKDNPFHYTWWTYQNIDPYDFFEYDFMLGGNSDEE